MREWALSGRDALTFTLAAAGDEPLPQELLVELETAVGTKVRLPLSQFGAIQPPLPAHILKADWIKPMLGFDKINVQTPYERVLQTYSLPLSAFQAANPAFQPGQLAAIRFVFNGQAAGSLYLDDGGIMGEWWSNPRGSRQ